MGIEIKKVNGTHGPFLIAKLNDKAQLLKFEYILGCVLQVLFQNVFGIGDQCSGKVPNGWIVLPLIQDFKILRFKGPEGDMIIFQ